MTGSTGLNNNFAEWLKEVDIRNDLNTKKTAVRIRRAISWLRRAEQESEDEDAIVVFLWISFNALYGVNIREEERMKYKTFLEEISKVDMLFKIHAAITKCHQSCIKLAENKYIDKDYWKYVYHHIKYPRGDEPEKTWSRAVEEQGNFGTITQIEYNCLKKNKQKTVTKNLINIFDRLYILRNQIVHGSATWSEYVNRDQVKDGAKVLETLIPVFIRLILSNTESGEGGKLSPKNWGEIYYPPYLRWDEEGYF